MRASSSPPNERMPAFAGLSKLNSETSLLMVEVDVDLGEPDHGRRLALASRLPSTSPAAPQRSSASEIPRKEVIQPQLPLRLPCYDFTPITDPTFDGCLPCGLAHRLRVLPTFVV